MMRLIPVSICKRYMSELGREISEMLETSPWVMDEYHLRHDASGIDFWIANGYEYFKLKDIRGMLLSESRFNRLLNAWDYRVLWSQYVTLCKLTAKRKLQSHHNEVINRIRLARIKENQL